MTKEEVRHLLNLNETLDVIKIEKGEVKGKKVNFVYVKSNKLKVRCTRCEMFSNKVHDYLKPINILYLKNSEDITYLVVYKRRFKCKNCRKSFTEDLGINHCKGTISNKVKQLILKSCMDKELTFSKIAEMCGITDRQVLNIFLEATKNYPNQVKNLPEIISFDETSTRTNKGLYSFILNDPIHKITLDILESRKKDFLINYFKKVENRKSVKVVICDLYKPYYEVVKCCFPNAIFVADPFHYIRYITEGLDNVRIRLEKEYNNENDINKYKLLKNRINRKLLLKSFNETKAEIKKREEEEKKYNEGKSKNQPYDKFNDFWYGTMKIKRNNNYIEIFRIDRLQEILNIHNDLSNAYNLKEEFMRIVTHVEYKDSKRQIKEWIKKCNDSKIPEMVEASKTIKNWLDEIVNSFKDERYSNGFTEANNNKIDKILSTAYGYKNFKIFRLRTLVILRKSYAGGSRKI